MGEEPSDNVSIVIATHKKCQMPADIMYLPLHVGAEGKADEHGNPLDFGYVKDNTGDNISNKNFCFGTQTALYWMWKNLDTEYKGLVHYRRYFVVQRTKTKNMLQSVMTYAQLKPMLGSYKVFVPKKRWYYVETLYSHYAHTHDENHLILTRGIIECKCPDYLKSYDKVLRRRWGFMFNMMILQKEFMDDYCSWLFEILFALFDIVDRTNMTAFERRFCGRISEILFDVWLEKKLETGELTKSEMKELPYVEDVHWKYKVKAFLSAKFLKRKYEASS